MNLGAPVPFNRASVFGEFRMILNETAGPVKGTRFQSHDHKRLIGHRVFTAQSLPARRNKAEAWIELSVSQDDDNATTDPLTFVKSGAHQL